MSSLNLKITSQMLTNLYALALNHESETGKHALRTQHYTKVLALRLRDMGHYRDQLMDQDIDLIFEAAVFHDIGKSGITSEIFQKAGLLTMAEAIIMKTHTNLGEAILIASKEKLSTQNELINKAIEMAVAHHECWDGSGYPHGLKGKAIPLAARILTIVDTYDALVNSRTYKKQWTHEEAVLEINLHAGICFEPIITEAFNLEEGHFKALAQSYRD